MSRTVRESEALVLLSAAGNRFHVWDGFVAEPPAKASAETSSKAVRLCAEGASDGLLLALPASTSSADCQMVLFNADGGRAETCGNGLRCVAKLMFEAGRLAGTRVKIVTDIGVVEVEVIPESDGRTVTSARVEFAIPKEMRALELELSGRENVGNWGIEPVEGTFVDIGNPHFVRFGESDLLESLPALGPELEHHAAFPHRANIEFASADSLRANTFTVRVWERGVGETQSCGSGACAVAFAAVAKEHADWPVTIGMPGGDLCVERRNDVLWLEGPVD